MCRLDAMSNPIKKFFEKRKLDVQFKRAAEGHKLADDTRASSSQQSGSPSSSNPRRQAKEMTEEQRKAADAAEARMIQPKPGLDF